MSYLTPHPSFAFPFPRTTPTHTHVIANVHAHPIKSHLSHHFPPSPLFKKPGVSICRIFNLSAEDLQYKLEALNFRAAATHSEIKQYTMESLTVLKTQFQQSLADAAAAAAAAARAMPAVKRRGPFGGVAGSGSGSANVPGGVGAGAAKSGLVTATKLPKYMQHNASVFVNKGLAPGAPMLKVERDGSLVAVQGADAGDGAAGVNVNVRFSVAFKQLDGEMKERKCELCLRCVYAIGWMRFSYAFFQIGICMKS